MTRARFPGSADLTARAEHAPTLSTRVSVLH